MKKDQEIINQEKIILQVCEALDDSVKRLDAETRQSIVAAREKALAKTPTRFSLPKLLTAAATAFSILLVAVILNIQVNQPLESDDFESIEMLAAQDTFELYEELEFYTWLTEEDVTS